MPRMIDADELLKQLQRKKCGPANKRYTEGFNDCLLKVRSMIHARTLLDRDIGSADSERGGE